MVDQDRGRVDSAGSSAGKKISRRRFLELGGAGLAGAGLVGISGCGGGSQGGGGSKSLIFSYATEQSGTLQKLIDKFNKQNKGKIKVRWRKMPAASSDYFDQIKTQLQSGQSDIDVIAGDVIWPAQFAAQGWILDLSDRFTNSMKKDFLGGPVQSLEYKGKTWGVPWFTDAGMFYYRKDLLKKSGFDSPPKTWDEMKSMVRKIRSDSGTKYGYVFQGSQDEGGVADALEWIWNAGGDVLQGDKVVVKSPSSVEGLKLRRSMITDNIAPRANTDYTTQDSQGTFTNGDVIFMRNWTFVYGLLADPKLSKVKQDQVGIARLPVVDESKNSVSCLGGWNFMVNAQSKGKLDHIWTFIKFMSAPEQQKTYTLGTATMPTRQNLYQDKEVLNKVPVAALAKEVLKSTKPRPRSPYYADMSLEMAQEFNSALKGNVPTKEALGTLEEKLKNIVSKS